MHILVFRGITFDGYILDFGSEETAGFLYLKLRSDEHVAIAVGFKCFGYGSAEHCLLACAAV